MSLTPLDVEKITFRTAFRGYARAEVEQFLAEVADALQGYLEQVRKQEERITAIERELERYHQNEDLLKSSVLLAQKTCDELTAAAHKQAEAIKREAELEGEGIRRQLTELKAEREQFEYAFHGLLTGFQRRLEQNNPQLAPQNQPAAETLHSPVDAPQAEQPEPDRPVGMPRQRSGPPPREDMFQPTTPQPAQPGISPRPAEPAPEGAEFDRDADIEDFSAALDDAPVPQKPLWPPPTEQDAGLIDAEPTEAE